MERPEGYPEEEASTNPNDTQISSWFWPGKWEDDTSFEPGEHEYFYSFGRSKSGKLSDPKLLAVVEFLRELFLRRIELLPQVRDRINEAAKKSGFRLWRVKSGNSRTRVVTTMPRSLSLGSGSGKYADPMVNEWIRITTINTAGSGGDPPGGSGRGGGSK